MTKNILNNRQNPNAGNDQRGKFLLHPMPKRTNMARTDTINKAD